MEKNEILLQYERKDERKVQNWAKAIGTYYLLFLIIRHYKFTIGFQFPPLSFYEKSWGKIRGIYFLGIQKNHWKIGF
jgi:hypothetical protein